MSPGASTRRTRARSRASGKRSRARRAAAAESRRERGHLRRRRSYWVGGALALFVIGAVLLISSGQLQEKLREVTLPLRHEDIIRQQAAEKRVPADLIAAVIFAESRFRDDQESQAGARGLMQVTPETAELIESLSGGSTFTADDLSDPDINIRYGTFYLRYLLDKFDGNLVAALAAYNAGETNVASWGGAGLRADDIRFDETRGFVDKVLEKRVEYRSHYAEELGLN